MQSVSLCDEVSVAITDFSRSDIVLHCCRSDIPTDGRNTAHKAAAAFMAATGKRVSLAIDINKRIPSQAGLGGGSADAAAVLVLLNILLETNLPAEHLIEIGAAVGADVPFCIVGGTGVCRGFGEKIERVSPLFPCFFVIVKPRRGVDTATAFRGFDGLQNPARPDLGSALSAISSGDVRSLGGALGNVFEQTLSEPARTENESIKSALLSHGAAGAVMTGSGSCVFGLFHSQVEAEKCAAALRESQGFEQVDFCAPAKAGVLTETF